VSFTATAGQSFLIRAGGWSASQGDGKLAITCGGGGGGGGGSEGCGPLAGDCFADNGTPGCRDADCCELICAHIPFCCENNWDASCAVFANDLCEGGDPAVCGNGVVEPGEQCDPPDGDTCGTDCRSLAVCGNNVVEPGEQCDPPDGVNCGTDCLFLPVCGNNRIERGEQCDPPNGSTCDDNCQIIGDVCVNGSGDCCTAHRSGGCDDEACCSAICDVDPTCCEVEWTEDCALGASILCTQCQSSGCDGAQGNCRTPHSNPGCSDGACCSFVCLFLPACCQSEWTQDCADLAEQIFIDSEGLFCGQ
jgi:hypothetical protein